MAELRSSEKEGDFRTETKYKQFAAAVDRGLKSFEVSTEWPDLISSLARMNKVLLAYMQYPVVPYQLTVCKRLSQCLHPNLPGGVHLKALDVYKAIFDRIGPKGLASNLLVYSSGLFPLLGHASMSVRPSLLHIYEKYYLPLGRALLPALEGLVLGLLPGLEEESEHTERISSLLDALSTAMEHSTFFSSLWYCVLHSPSSRLPAISYVLSKLSKKVTAEDQMDSLGGSLPLVVSAIQAALLDKNVLVARGALDIVSILFPFHQPFLLPSDTMLVLSAAMETLLKRDVSLNRRFSAWLLGSQADKSYLAKLLSKTATEETPSDYFQVYTRTHLLSASRRVISRAVDAAKLSSRPECLLPYRLLRALLDRPDIGDCIMEDVLLELASCLKEQVEILGGPQAKDVVGTKQSLTHALSEELPKKLGKKASLKAEILQSANLFFNSLKPGQFWDWMSNLLVRSFRRVADNKERTLKRTNHIGENSMEAVAQGEAQTRGKSEPLPPEASSVSLTLERSDTAVTPGSTDVPSLPPYATVVGLIDFLVQSLPLDSIEDVYQFHLPQLLLVLLRELHRHGDALTTSELHSSLKLVSYIIHELVRSPASHMTSHASTPLSSQLRLTPISEDSKIPFHIPIPTTYDQEEIRGDVPVVEPLGEMKREITSLYLDIFPSLIAQRIRNSKETDWLLHNVVVTSQRPLSNDMRSLFTTACHTLVLISQLGGGEGREEEPSDIPAWLVSLTSSCLLSHDIQVTFVAMATLLELLERTGHGESSSDHPFILSSTIQQLFSKTSFIQSVSQLLWSCLSHEYPHLHVESTSLLCRLHTLVAPSLICERVLLEDFAQNGLAAYHKFATLWKYMPSNSHSRSFNRALLRMLEGLHTPDVAIKCFVQSWVKFITRRSELAGVFQPLLKILLETESHRKRQRPSESKADDKSYFYYPPGEEPEEEEEDHWSEVAVRYTQVFDASQVLYAMSLLLSMIAVDPVGVTSCLSCTVVNTATYGTRGDLVTSSGDSTGSLETPSSLPTSKSLLELLLLTCVDYLLGEYPESLEASLGDNLDNLRVKVAAVELLGTVLQQFTFILSQSEGVEASGAAGVLKNPSYISALVTLCDIQRITLLLLGQVVQKLRNGVSECQSYEVAERERLWSDGSQNCAGDASVGEESLFVHLLRLVQFMITLETHCNPTSAFLPSSTINKPKPKSVSGLPSVLPSLPTAAQPFLHVLLLDILADFSLSHLHKHLLYMFRASLPNLQNQLCELAPKVLKQLCKALDKALKSDKEASRNSRNNTPQDFVFQKLGGDYVISCLESLVSTVLWCLFGEDSFEYLPSEGQLKHHSPNQFLSTSSANEMEDMSGSLTPSSRQPSTVAWLFGVFSMNQKGGMSSDAGGKTPHLGAGSKVGQYVIMLLPAVYNSITDIWRYYGGKAGVSSKGGMEGSAGRKMRRKMEFEDIQQLISCLLSPLAQRESTTFFSSISHVWLEWNLESKVQVTKRLAKRKEAFTEMMHKIKVLPLERFIRCVQFTLNDIVRSEDFESGILRQKYLLHFLYKYISSTLQSSEELGSCRGALVLFLRDCYIPSSESLCSNCHILCMLTSILHVFVCRVTAPEQKKQKKERKELQDITHKLCEALSIAASVSNAILHDFVVVKGAAQQDQDEGSLTTTRESTPASVDRTGVTDTTTTSMEESSGGADIIARHRAVNEIAAVDVNNRSPLVAVVAKQQQNSALSEQQLPTVQALAVLANVLSHFMDCVFGSTEKDKVYSLLKAVLYNIWPHLHNHSSEARQCYKHAVKLLSSLSEFQITRKAWKKETIDLYLASDFFITDLESLQLWKVIVDNLMTQDKVTFRDLISRLHYSSTTGVVNIFSSSEQEVTSGARLLKRLAFAILSGETDQYVRFLPDIQEKLSECLKFQRHPPICCEVFLNFRVLLLKLSLPHLLSFWPAIVTEMLAILSQMETDLSTELSNNITLSKEKLQLYLAACKLLDTAMSLPTEFLPHFQLLQWGFGSHDSPTATSSSGSIALTRLHRHFTTTNYPPSPTKTDIHSHPFLEPPYLQMSSISSLRELKPLFHALSTYHLHSNTAAARTGEMSTLGTVEKVLMLDFLEPSQSRNHKL